VTANFDRRNFGAQISWRFADEKPTDTIYLTEIMGKNQGNIDGFVDGIQNAC
jgi:hypothetical protein